MAFTVFVTDDAARDLKELITYIERHDSPDQAAHVLGKIEDAILSLVENPHRGVHPPELISVGVREFREIFFKPYRMVYRVMDKKVCVMLVVDGRRDLQTILHRRLLGDQGLS